MQETRSGDVNPVRSRRDSKGSTVVTLVTGVVAPFELGVPCEVFGLDRSDIASPWYRFLVCSPEREPLRTETGFTIQTAHGLEALEQADLVVIPVWNERRPAPREVLDAVRAAHDRGARIMSVCTGAFVLAEAGLLDGRRATTHWMHAVELARRYPKVIVDPRVLYVDEGDVLTSAGTAAGIDLCLHVVRQDYGAEVANAVARRMVVPPHRDGGQAQFVEAPVPASPSESLAGTLGYMLEHLNEPLAVDDLAERAHLSPRTFARRFRTVTGTTPHQWLLGQRVLLAQRLLETTDDPIEVIATQCGFGSAGALRSHFQRQVATSPFSYRRTFRAAG